VGCFFFDVLLYYVLEGKFSASSTVPFLLADFLRAQRDAKIIAGDAEKIRIKLPIGHVPLSADQHRQPTVQ